MSESLFKIRERTAVIFGPINSIVQTLGNVLQEQGADVAFLDVSASESHRFISNLMDMRQIHSHYGRAASIDCDVKSSQDAKEALSRAAEIFGSVDILIDANMGQRDLNDESCPTYLMTKEASEFFIGRGKGRNIFLTYDDSICKHVKAKNILDNNKKLQQFIVEKSQKFRKQQVTTNCVGLPFTDEFLLEHFPKESIQTSIENIKKDWPEAKLANPLDIAYVVAFLASPMSAAIDAQFVNASYGMNH